LRYNDPTYLAFFGGKQAMIDSPLIQEYFGEEIAAAAAAAAAKARAEERATATADTKRKVLQRFLKSRFGEIEPEMASTIQAIQDENKLDDLIDWAGCCLNLEEFRSRLA
jgi:lipid A disaccharide synthetase